MMLLLAATPRGGETPSLALAREAAAWIRLHAIATRDGLTWPGTPGDRESISTSLYSGSSGVVLFFLELARATGDVSYLADARGGADHLLTELETEGDCGLYTGLAGIGTALRRAYEATGDARYRDGARRCIALLRERALRAGRGIEWPEQGNDVISGAAGDSLPPLFAGRRGADPPP